MMPLQLTLTLALLVGQPEGERPPPAPEESSQEPREASPTSPPESKEEPQSEAPQDAQRSPPERALEAPPEEKARENQYDNAPEPAPRVPPPAFETVVSASGWKERVFETPRSVEVLEGASLRERHARSLPEALEESDGVFVQQTNRGAGAPILRGLVGPQNLIVVDDVRFNTSVFRTGPNQYLSTIDPFAMDRIELIRGASSVRYGNGAMGGVIHILTPNPRDASPRALAAGWVQSEDSAVGGRLQLRDMADDVAYLAGGSITEFGTLRAGNGRQQPLSAYTTAGWHGKLQWRLAPSLHITAAYLGSLIRNAGRTDRLGQGDIRFSDNDDHLGYVKGEWTSSGVLRKVQAVLSLHHTFERTDRFNCAAMNNLVDDLEGCVDRAVGVVTRQRILEDEVNVLGAEVGAQLAFWDDRIRVDTGVESYFDFVGSRQRDARDSDDFVFQEARGNFSDDSRYRTIGVFAHGDAELWRHETAGRLLLNGGARLSHFGAKANNVPGLGDVRYNFTGGVGSAGVQYVLPERLNLYATFLQGFRAPNLQETTVLGDTGSKFEIPNDDLSPERSNTLEIGARAKALGFTAEVAYFFTKLSDFIGEESATFQGLSDVDGSPVVRRVNDTKGEFQGVEAALQGSWHGVTTRHAITWTVGDITSGAGITSPARRVPPIFGTSSLRYDTESARGYAEIVMQWADRQDRLGPSDQQDLRICEVGQFTGELRSPCRGTPGWVTLGLRGGWRFGEHFDLMVALLNLTNEKYRRHGSGVLAPGFGGRVSLTARLP